MLEFQSIIEHAQNGRKLKVNLQLCTVQSNSSLLCLIRGENLYLGPFNTPILHMMKFHKNSSIHSRLNTEKNDFMCSVQTGWMGASC